MEITNLQKTTWEAKGVLVVEQILDETELTELRLVYDDFLANKYDLTGLRSDLSGAQPAAGQKVERITQIMRPSLVLPSLAKSTAYQKVIAAGQALIGADAVVDFDMLIDKAPGTNAETPWHQDAAYWLDMPDKRAVSFWIALDDVDLTTGCMRYVPSSHTAALRNHFQPTPNAALQCEVGAQEPVFYGIISAGTAIAHHGYTLHGALGNRSADRHRRALIINLRPEAMVKYLRERGYDHLGTRKPRAAEGKEV